MEMMSQEIGELAAALSAAQETMLLASEGSKNPFFKSKYANYNAVRDAVKGPLTTNGLSWCHLVSIVDGCPSVVTILMHKSGQWLKSVFPIPQTKGDAQSMGSAITYLKRYSLAAITGCATGTEEDDDGERAMIMHREPKKPQNQPKSFSLDDVHEKIPDVGIQQLEDYFRMLTAKTGKSMEYVIEQSMIVPETLDKIRTKILEAKK